MENNKLDKNKLLDAIGESEICSICIKSVAWSSGSMSTVYSILMKKKYSLKWADHFQKEILFGLNVM